MKKFLKPALLVVLGIVIAFPLFSMTYYTMARTSTPRFCSTCHEIVPAYQAWKTSSHRNNPQGIQANCMDCHLPPPEDTIDFFYAKTLHGAKDVFFHFVRGADAYDRPANRAKAYESMDNENCMKCHRNIENIPEKRGAMLAHRTVLYGKQRKCVDCHNKLVHVDRTLYAYKEFQAPYRSPGITFNSKGEVVYPTLWGGEEL